MGRRLAAGRLLGHSAAPCACVRLGCRTGFTLADLPHRRRHPSQPPPKVQRALFAFQFCSYIDPSQNSLTMAPKDTIYYDLLEVKVDASPIEYVCSLCMLQNQCADRSKQA